MTTHDTRVAFLLIVDNDLNSTESLPGTFLRHHRKRTRPPRSISVAHGILCHAQVNSVLRGQ